MAVWVRPQKALSNELKRVFWLLDPPHKFGRTFHHKRQRTRQNKGDKTTEGDPPLKRCDPKYLRYDSI